ncbi:MAG: hypothetical protein ABFC42_07260 [Sulfuricella sp.]
MKIRRGDTWDFVGQAQLKEFNGALADLSACSIKSEVRACPSGKLLAKATCEWIDASAQTFSHKIDDTSHWPIGAAMLDIVIVNSDGREISSDVALIDVVGRVTL